MTYGNLVVKNYKCFDKEDGVRLDDLNLINIIIGKNNSGKTTILEAIEMINSNDETNIELKWELVIDKEITDSCIEGNSLYGTATKEWEEVFKCNPQEYGINGCETGNCENNEYLPKTVVFTKFPQGVRYFVTLKDVCKKLKRKYQASNELLWFNKKVTVCSGESYMEALSSWKTPHLILKKVYYLAAERDIKPEEKNDKFNISKNGDGLTNAIQCIINDATQDITLVQRILLKDLNEITAPDIHFKTIFIRGEQGTSCWEIYFEDSDSDEYIPLSKMGSGIKTILLVLCIIHIQCKYIDKKEYKECIFTFEELDNNLHPSMQRRLYDYLYNFAKREECMLFLTTHSNIVIDIFGDKEEAQIYHVNKEKNKVSVKTVGNFAAKKEILMNLGVKASDILQSNGIIWVEGPSDKIYLNKWISLVDKDLQEGRDYSILTYGGKLLAHYAAHNDNEREQKFIEMLKVNTNGYVVLDSDKKNEAEIIRETKQRVIDEMKEGYTWLTEGREIENYLTKRTINEWLKSKSLKPTYKYEQYKQLSKTHYKEKTKSALEIVKYIEVEDLEILDLKAKIEGLVKIIRDWNHK